MKKMEQAGKCFISNKRQVGRVQLEKKREERERKEDAGA